jgi:hypothetical protein
MRAAIGAVGKHLARIIRQSIRSGATVVDVGRGHRDLLDQRRARIRADMGFEAERIESAINRVAETHPRKGLLDRRAKH